jgi:hypothetical protein
LSNSAVFSYNPPYVEYGNYIISIKPVPVKAECYDFSVEKYHNYFAGGLIHHNTYSGIAEDIAHMMGFRPWLKETDPDYRIDIKTPNIGLVVGETVMHSIAEKIVPTFRELIPDYCKAVFKAGPTGVPISVMLPIDVWGKKCGSMAYLRSYDQRADTFEGIDFAWLHCDEPPPEDVLQAIERGKVVTNAPSWYTMTPLKEAHFYSKFSSRAGIRV